MQKRLINQVVLVLSLVFISLHYLKGVFPPSDFVFNGLRDRSVNFILYAIRIISVMVWLRPATKAPRGRPSPHQGAEENEKKQAETGGSG